MSPEQAIRPRGRARSANGYLFAGRHALRIADPRARRPRRNPRPAAAPDLQRRSASRLRSIDKTIPPELETILDQGDRQGAEPTAMPTARAMADDLRRFLEDEPILARPPSALGQGGEMDAASPGARTVGDGDAADHRGRPADQHRVDRPRRQRQKSHISLKQKKRRKPSRAAQLRREEFQAGPRDAVEFFTQVAAEKMTPGQDPNQLRKQMLETSLIYYQGFLEDHKNDPGTGESLALADRTFRRSLMNWPVDRSYSAVSEPPPCSMNHRCRKT